MVPPDKLLQKAPLYYIICRSLLASPFWSHFRRIPDLYADIPIFYSEIILLSAAVCSLRLCPWSARAVRK